MKESANKPRLTNWDLLRSLAMLFVVVVHTSRYMGPIHGYNPEYAIGTFAIICDPVFFALSGYFALRPLKTDLKGFYLNKLITVVFPLVLYSVLLYLFTSFNDLSLGGYFKFFSELLVNGWWFIPTLIPCLIAAPFLYKGIESLSDKGLVSLTKVFVGLCITGIILMTSRWAFAQIGIETLSYFFDLMYRLVPPSILSTSILYFQFFILGGVFGRLLPLMPQKAANVLIVIGLGCWMLDIVWRVAGIPRTDPSFLWVFSTFGIMTAFSRLSIKGPRMSLAITWVAKRSYSIYLLQFTTISIICGFVYDQAIFGDVYQMAAITRIVIWTLSTMASYLLALLVASICDPLVLNKLQTLLKKLLFQLSPRRECRLEKSI